MNIEPEARKILPRYGVYACRVMIDGKWYNGVGNAGVKPTVTDERRRLLKCMSTDMKAMHTGRK